MLNELIAQTAKKKNITLKRIAKDIGISPAAISNFLRGKTEISFYSALRIVRYLFPDNEREIMMKHLKTLRKPENLRMAMEYTSLQNMLGALEWLIDSELRSHNIVNREWAKVYDLELKWKKGEINPHELIGYNRNLRVNTQEMMFLRQWFDYYYYHRYEKNYGVNAYISENIEALLNDLDDPFIHKCFSTRFYITVVTRYLYADDLIKARYYAQLMINNSISPEYTARTYHLLGLSYLYEDFNKALDNLRKAKKIFVELNLQEEFLNVDKSIYFVSNYWNKEVNIFYKTSDPDYLQEVAHQAIKHNDLQKARRILESIDFDKLTMRSKAFQYYYLGLCYNSINYFYNSLTMFNRSGNKFFARLPYLELLRAGEKKEAVTAAFGELLV